MENSKIYFFLSPKASDKMSKNQKVKKKIKFSKK